MKIKIKFFFIIVFIFFTNKAFCQQEKNEIYLNNDTLHYYVLTINDSIRNISITYPFFNTVDNLLPIRSLNCQIDSFIVENISGYNEVQPKDERMTPILKIDYIIYINSKKYISLLFNVFYQNNTSRTWFEKLTFNYDLLNNCRLDITDLTLQDTALIKKQVFLDYAKNINDSDCLDQKLWIDLKNFVFDGKYILFPLGDAEIFRTCQSEIPQN